MITHKIDWADFKAKLTPRNLSPQWVDSNSSYYIYGKDGFICFACEIEQEEPATSDQVDFESNYKDDWNSQLDYRNDKGVQQIVVSPRPNNTVTYFGGISDVSGAKLQFNLTASDTSITKSLEFNENVYLKDAIVITKDAPIGSYLEAKVVHPTAGVLQYFCKNFNLLGSQAILINSEDQELLPLGLKLEITVYNAPVQVAFEVVGNLEMYRTNTI